MTCITASGDLAYTPIEEVIMIEVVIEEMVGSN